MLDKLFTIKLRRTIIYAIIFTLLFVVFTKTLRYTLPFVLALVIALSTKKFNLYLQKKLKMSNGLASIITTTLVFTVLIVLLTLIVYKLTSEAILLITRIPSLDSMTDYINIFLNKLTELMGQIDEGVIVRIYTYLETLLRQVITRTGKIINGLITTVIKIPNVLLVFVITFIATYIISKDYSIFNQNFYSIFSDDGKEKMRNIIQSAIDMTIGYIKAYALVVFITFMQVLIGFLIFKIDFAFILSVLCAFLDLLPIVGIIIIFIPLIVYNFIIGNNFVAIGLIVLFILVQVVRQIIEPKIVSTTIDVHPLLILASIFIGLKLNGFVGMIYFIALIVGYKILVKVNVL